MTGDSGSRPGVGRGQRNLLLAAAALTCALVAMGGIVCATESGAACPDWPGCYGRVVPPPQVNAIIEYTHRFIAILTSPIIIAAAVVGWRKYRTIPWVSRPPIVAIPFLLAVITFGALVVLRGLPPGLAAVDLGSALVVLALITAAATAASAWPADRHMSGRLSLGSFTARLSLATLVAVFAVHVSGILVAGQGSLTRCLGWPLWRVLPYDVPGWPQTARLAISAVAALLVITLVLQVRRTAREHPALMRSATAVGLLFVIQMVLGRLMLSGSSSVVLLVTYVITAALLWVLLVVVAMLAGLAAAQAEWRSEAGWRGRVQPVSRRPAIRSPQ